MSLDAGRIVAIITENGSYCLSDFPRADRTGVTCFIDMLSDA